MAEDHRPAAASRFDRLLEKLLFASITGELHAETWRRNVLELGLRVCVVLGSVVYVPSVSLAARSGKWGVAAVDSAAIVAIVVLARVRSPGYTFRATAFSLVLYALGVALLVEVGPICQIYLFGFSLIATVLLGVRAGVRAVVLNGVSLLVIGLAGRGSPRMAAAWHPTGVEAWVVITMNFFLVNIVLVLAVGVVLVALERIARREQEARAQLERERTDLVTANAALDRQMRERKSLESQLVQAQKMEIVGQLAGGVAHDFNNLLTVVNGCGDLLLRGLPADAPARPLVEDILRAGRRGADLTRQLLAFSRQQVLRAEVFDPNRVLADTAKLLTRLLGEDVALRTVFDPAAGFVKGDAGQVEQVVINLAVNGRDAMPRGGTLVVETAPAEVTAADLSLSPDARPGRYVRLAVTDTGTGMPPEVRARLFEPFFTTKPAGKGTGLGLATAYGIVRQSAGFLTVRSEPGTGTTIAAYFPRHEGEPAQPRAAPTPEPGAAGSETVLVVEDDDQVRALTTAVLVRQGYRVEATDSGPAALAACDRLGAPPDLVLTDVVMPGMSGRELAEVLTARFPGLKVVFLSGYTADAVLRHGVEEERVAFLQKPYTPDALARFVREVLDGTAGPWSKNSTTPSDR